MDKEINTVYIYALVDPVTSLVRYIGKSKNPLFRYTQHCYAYDNNDKDNWILLLKSRGLKPEMKIIDKVPTELAHEKEAFYINDYAKKGHPLFNLVSLNEWATISIKIDFATLERLRIARIKSGLEINDFYRDIFNKYLQSK
jgi:hypothetical protein